MSNPITQRYKIQFMIALVVALGIIALTGEAYWLNAVLTILGAILGVVMMDMEYVIDSYLLDTASPLAQQLKSSYQKDKFIGLVTFFNENESKYKDLPIRSVLFQVLLTSFGYYIALTHAFPFAVALVLTMLGVIIYSQIVEYAKIGNIRRWFWIYNGNVTQNGEQAYMVAMVFLFVLLFFFI